MIETDIGNPIPPLKKPGTVFWILGVFIFLWNAIGGCGMFLMYKMASDEMILKEGGQAALDAMNAYPVWANIAWAIAVWVGLLAAILLLLRKKLAAPLFIVSFIAVLICFIPNFTNPVVQAAEPETYWIMPVIVALLGLFEIWWSRRKVADGTLN